MRFRCDITASIKEFIPGGDHGHMTYFYFTVFSSIKWMVIFVSTVSVRKKSNSVPKTISVVPD